MGWSRSAPCMNSNTLPAIPKHVEFIHLNLFCICKGIASPGSRPDRQVMSNGASIASGKPYRQWTAQSNWIKFGIKLLWAPSHCSGPLQSQYRRGMWQVRFLHKGQYPSLTMSHSHAERCVHVKLEGLLGKSYITFSNPQKEDWYKNVLKYLPPKTLSRAVLQCSERSLSEKERVQRGEMSEKALGKRGEGVERREGHQWSMQLCAWLGSWDLSVQKGRMAGPC